VTKLAPGHTALSVPRPLVARAANKQTFSLWPAVFSLWPAVTPPQMFEQTLKTSPAPPPAPTELQVLLCSLLIMLITFSYMAPFVTVGSFVTYYNCKYGSSFYTILNIVFYSPGLGVTLLQSRLDRAYDTRFGFKRTFFFRMAVVQLLQSLCCLSFAYGQKIRIVFGSILLGICTWVAHGTVSSLSALFPPIAIGFFSLGMQLPNVYSFSMVFLMGLQNGGNNHAEEVYTDYKIQVFYLSTAGISILGILAMFVLVSMKTTQQIQDGYALSCNVEEGGPESGEESQSTPLLSEAALAPPPPTSRDRGDSVLERMLSSSTSGGVPISFALRPGPGTDVAGVYRRVRAHRWLLFLTIFSAVLTGSFFSSVPSDNHFNIAQALYFTRLAGDLGGRLIAISLPRPSFFDGRLTGLTFLLVVRLVLLLVFFVYIIPGQTFLPLYDTAVQIAVGVCACQSGFTASLLYEYAAKEFEGDSSCRSETTRALNMSFQYACFGAVVAAVILLVPLGGTFELEGRNDR
jgi:hypothetical protein